MVTGHIEQTSCAAVAMTSAPAEAAGPPRALHSRSFKLRFAAQREPGRSYVSLSRPLNLPCVVSGKFYSGVPTAGEVSHEAEAGQERALRRVRDALSLGPRDKYSAPLTTSQEYGWWPGTQSDRRLMYHIRDSAWLRARLAVLAADERAART